ncbi:MAG TPA: hypothetical protein VK581_04105 [Chthoniobacterales bacterium]|nr:hypothetical protein [Chthoniobacterales bacterium]
MLERIRATDKAVSLSQTGLADGCPSGQFAGIWQNELTLKYWS